MKRLQPRPRRPAPGAPSWIITFADLMTLLLTFFILLLSFSKMDAEKYKAIANAMGMAFGASWVQAEAIGGTPLTLTESNIIPPPPPSLEPPPIIPKPPSPPPPGVEDVVNAADKETIEPGIEELATLLVQGLEEPMAAKQISVNYDSRKVVIRFSEEASFPSGSAEMKPEMRPIIDKIVSAITHCQGDLVVSGYTDDRPIISNRFRSNWDLSAARAVSVVHELVMNHKIDSNRVMAAGHAETNPLAPNTSPEQRARNRRVEIKIYSPDCKAGTPGALSLPAPIRLRSSP